MPVHHALRKIITLHPVLVCRTIWEIIESRLPKVAVLQPPIVLQTKPDTITYRPIIILAFHWDGQGPSLRMALDASVVGCHRIHVSRIEYVSSRGMDNVLASRTVAALAADIPFRYLL